MVRTAKKTKFNTHVKVKKIFSACDSLKLLLFIAACCLLFFSHHYSADAQIISMNLIGKDHVWSGFGSAKVSQSKAGLLITVATSNAAKNLNRGVLEFKLPGPNISRHLEIDYVTTSHGNASFVAELRQVGMGINNTTVLWSQPLESSNNLVPHVFTIQSGSLKSLMELRIYVITEGPGSHSILIKKAILTPLYLK